MGRVRSEAGFSLTELLISVIVVSIGVVGFATAVGLASTELWLGRRDTEIALLSADQLERLKNVGYQNLSIGEVGERTVGDYQFHWEVQDGEGDTKKIVLESRYPGHDGRERADTLVSYLGPR